MPVRLLSALLLLTLLAPVGAQESDKNASDEARRTLDRAIKAAGGQRALNRLKGPMMRMDRGKLYSMGEPIPFIAQYATKWPDWYRQEIEGVYALTVSGDRAWVTGRGGFLQKLGGEQLEEQLHQVRGAWTGQLFPLTQKSYKLAPVKGVQVNDKATVGIRARREKGRDIKFFFDKKTYLLVKVETEIVSPQYGPKPVLSETYFSEHRSVGGARLPAKAKVYHGKKLVAESELVDYKMGATLDPEQFKLPE